MDNIESMNESIEEILKTKFEMWNDKYKLSNLDTTLNRDTYISSYGLWPVNTYVPTVNITYTLGHSYIYYIMLEYALTSFLYAP